MWEIWANYLLPKALKSGPKSNKSPNLVTLAVTYVGKKVGTYLSSYLQIYLLTYLHISLLKYPFTYKRLAY